ncbi:gamma-glutamyl-gamma-aminobutyrate hydrolase family protein [Aeromicrobium sp.]|uniref:gamma-glutamyl-gamma-aminobutyrate hydrolase family protein n=1 Tax=Aeromicrobium sp. TaxID=1871063 RepID=UPI0030BDE448
MRPLIGVTTYREQVRWGIWHEQADVLHAVYSRSIEAAGGIAVLLPPGDPSGAEAVVARVDGLIIAGGADVEPARYAAQPHDLTVGWRADRDAWELALLDAAATAGLPALGICRGMQVMAVHAGGTLDQHTPDLVGGDDHSPGGDEFGVIDVDVVPGTLLGRAVGDKGLVHCHHHQSVREHPGFIPAAHAADGTLEAMEDPSRRFWLGVQWHPETKEDAGLFRALVDAAGGQS